jgi:hypothetical protein
MNAARYKTQAKFANQESNSFSSTIADSYNSQSSRVDNRENLGNTALTVGDGAGRSNVDLVLAGGLVLAGLALALR